jgi:pimeloyl-ACP methyl ester carboxylesterase
MTRGAIGALLGTSAACGRLGEPVPPIGQFVSVGDQRLHYVAMGDGPPVILIHGASGNLRDFSFSLTARLAEAGFRAIAFDRPGFGYSPRPAKGAEDPAIQARLLRLGADMIGAPRPIVVGHSYGGAVAMAWAVEAPKETRGVVSLAGATYPWGGDAGLLYRLGANPITGGVVRRVAGLLVDVDDPDPLLSRVFKPQEPPPGYGGYIGVGLALRPETFTANAEDLNALNDMLKIQAPRYRELTMPVEAIHGDADRTVWAEVHSKPLVDDVENGRLTMLEGVGHMPHHADEAAVVAAVARIAAATA